jgi:RNA polymerase sigma-70 factor, ECF subfamily
LKITRKSRNPTVTAGIPTILCSHPNNTGDILPCLLDYSIDGGSKRPRHQPSENRVSDRWEAIVREHAPTVLGTAWRILGHAAEAEDIAQEVFLEAYSKWNDRPVSQWACLLKRIAVCRSLDRRRRRKPAAGSAPLAEISSGEPGPIEVAVARELTVLLRQAIDKLPQREAEVFCLRYFEALNHSEIAMALDIKPRAVATALYKARTKLEQELEHVLKVT